MEVNDADPYFYFIEQAAQYRDRKWREYLRFNRPFKFNSNAIVAYSYTGTGIFQENFKHEFLNKRPFPYPRPEGFKTVEPGPGQNL
jgi:hypothetical protein